MSFMSFTYRFCMMMRLNFKTTLLVLVVATLSFLLASWNNCGSLLFHTAKYQHKARQIYDLYSILYTYKRKWMELNVLIHISIFICFVPIFIYSVIFYILYVSTESFKYRIRISRNRLSYKRRLLYRMSQRR